MMNRVRLSSVLQLLVIGSIAVITPLIFAVYYAANSFDELVDRHRGEVQRLVTATRDSMASRNLIVDMERVALQYQLLGQEGFQSLFHDLYTSFSTHLDRMGALLPEEARKESLTPLAAQVNEIRRAVQELPPSSPELDEALNGFARASDLANELNRNIRQLVDDQITQTEARIGRAQGQVFLFSVLVIPITTLLLLLFIYWVSRPIGQLTQAIHQLGDNDYEHPIHVGGPADLNQLGQLLDWLRQRLNELEQEKRKFLRHMSHELKTPLAGLREGTDLLLEEIPGPLTAEQKDVVGILNKNTHTLQRLIDNLLDYNLLLDSDRVHREPTAIDSLIQRVVDTYLLLAKPRDVRFEVDGPALTYSVDKAKLRAALDNVVSNAVSFSPQSGVISINWKLTEQGLAIRVVDDGPGISTTDQQRIFEAFYQGEAKRRGSYKGTGLGLSIAWECLTAQDGRISVENVANRGAAFTLELPPPTS